ncbi:MAG: pyrroloquinoline quinone biosynthesis peptide chaperone PqqD [Hyphomicrobiales bacterium]
MTSANPTEPSGTARPRLPRGVRLKHDEVRQEWLLLAPERALKTDAIAVEIIKRCTGERTVDEIVDELARVYAADRARIDADVRALLSSLASKRLLDL